MKLATRAALGAATFVLATQSAGAHPMELHFGGFGAGFAHPFLGADHVLAMIAMGAWAAQCAGRARAALLAAFVAAIGGGGAFAMTGATFPNLDAWVATSVLAVGLFIALGIRLRPPVAALAALFALLHGYAHGLETPATTTPLLYSAGFLLASCALVACGLYAGRWIGARPLRARTFGACIVTAGTVLIAGA